MGIKNLLKKIASLLPRPVTKNDYYDRLTEAIIKKVCDQDSVCVDVGANEGTILQMIIHHCPKAIHYAFEPLPHLYFSLKRKYGSAANIYNLALSNKTGSSSFIYTKSDAAYSGFNPRKMTSSLGEETIQVQTDTLDHIIPPSTPVRLVKIDVEGAEYQVLQGAQRILTSYHPVVLFEFGKGGADEYDVTPAIMFSFLQSTGYSISLLKEFTKSSRPLSLQQFEDQYRNGNEYFFVAYHETSWHKK